MSSTTRMARCCCGKLQVEARGEPKFVVACHCMECQRRTGSVFGVSAYYPKGQISAQGVSNLYIRGGQNGRKLRLHFCPECGSSVYWEAEIRPDYVGIAVGAFADPDFPVPVRSVWEQSRHPWLSFEHKPDRFMDQSTPHS